MEFLISPNFWSSVLASTTPVLLATLAANIMTKAGMFNLGIEGTMLMCALAGVLASAFTGSLFVGALLGVLLGILVSFVLGYFILKMNAPMNACGVAINLAATGGTVFILAMVCGSKNNSTSIVSASFPNINIPILKDIPVLGQILSGQNFVTYLSSTFRRNQRSVNQIHRIGAVRRVLRVWRYVSFYGSDALLYCRNGFRTWLYVPGYGCYRSG